MGYFRMVGYGKKKDVRREKKPNLWGFEDMGKGIQDGKS